MLSFFRVTSRGDFFPHTGVLLSLLRFFHWTADRKETFSHTALCPLWGQGILPLSGGYSKVHPLDGAYLLKLKLLIIKD